MECKKCNTDIPSIFEYVLAQNICPKCGSKIMQDLVMKTYLDIKKRLNEVEFVMDKGIVCDRIAMFMVNNYEIQPLSPLGKNEKETPVITDKATLMEMKAQLPSIDIDNDNDLSEEEIREQEAIRAGEIAEAREMGFNIDDNGEVLNNNLTANRIARLKKIATSNKSVVRRSE